MSTVEVSFYCRSGVIYEISIFLIGNTDSAIQEYLRGAQSRTPDGIRERFLLAKCEQ